jgi:membrane-associated protease RseP (regulator of RpoE activity)
VQPVVWALGIGLAFAPAEKAEESGAKPIAVPFELLPTKHIAVQVRINGKGPYRVIFDTGAPVLLLGSRAAKESGVLGGGAPAPIFGMLGGTGQFSIKKLELGALVAKDISTVVMDHPAIEVLSSVFGPLEGIVGFPFFARYKMTIDYQKQELTFTPSGYRPPDALKAMLATMMAFADDQPTKNILAPGALWGLVVQKKDGSDESGVEVVSVASGGPAAAAGIRVGDRVLSVDGRWTDSVIDLYRAAGYVKPNVTAPVIIRRDGKDLELAVRPRAGL